MAGRISDKSKEFLTDSAHELERPREIGQQHRIPTQGEIISVLSRAGRLPVQKNNSTKRLERAIDTTLQDAVEGAFGATGYAEALAAFKNRRQKQMKHNALKNTHDILRRIHIALKKRSYKSKIFYEKTQKQLKMQMDFLREAESESDSDSNSDAWGDNELQHNKSKEELLSSSKNWLHPESTAMEKAIDMLYSEQAFISYKFNETGESTVVFRGYPIFHVREIGNKQVILSYTMLGSAFRSESQDYVKNPVAFPKDREVIKSYDTLSQFRMTKTNGKRRLIGAKMQDLRRFFCLDFPEPRTKPKINMELRRVDGCFYPVKTKSFVGDGVTVELIERGRHVFHILPLINPSPWGDTEYAAVVEQNNRIFEINPRTGSILWEIVHAGEWIASENNSSWIRLPTRFGMRINSGQFGFSALVKQAKGKTRMKILDKSIVDSRLSVYRHLTREIYSAISVLPQTLFGTSIFDDKERLGLIEDPVIFTGKPYSLSQYNAWIRIRAALRDAHRIGKIKTDREENDFLLQSLQSR